MWLIASISHITCLYLGLLTAAPTRLHPCTCHSSSTTSIQHAYCSYHRKAQKEALAGSFCLSWPRYRCWLRLLVSFAFTSLLRPYTKHTSTQVWSSSQTWFVCPTPSINTCITQVYSGLVQRQEEFYLKLEKQRQAQ